MPLSRLSLLTCASLLGVSAPGFAQPAPAEEGSEVPSDPHGDHAGEGTEIVITGFRRPRAEILSGTSVVSGGELARELRSTIGETLARQPGVSATSFGPNASRPVLRGFQGERIRVLTDGIGSLDVSNTSVDHAVAVNPLTAQRIEVLRGPAALLFGSSAIGGVVNVIDARIPRRLPTEFAHIQALGTYGSAANERSVNGTVDIPVGGGFIVHFDGNHTRTDDLRIGGFVLSEARRREALASDEAEIRALANLSGRLPNSAGRITDVAGGIAWISGENNVGFSLSRVDSLYGIPVRYSLGHGDEEGHDHDEGHEDHAPRIDMRQNRADVRAEIDTGDGFIDTLRFRGGWADYRHDELEQDGRIGTTFLSDGYEARLELAQRRGGGFGAQYFQRDLSVSGAEKYLPVSRTRQFGIFGLQTFRAGPLRAEVGARYEHQTAKAEADADLGNPAIRRSFDSISGSAGASYELVPGFRLGLNGSHSQRAPAAEELFANGPHAGTQAFEVGNPNLRKERSWGLELTARAQGEGFEFGASVFHSWFDNYIFERFTGEIEDELPVFRITQGDARYFGIEAEASVRVARIGDFAINVDGIADYIRATIVGSGAVPRIPPLRLLGGIEAQSETLQGRVEVERVFAQNRIAQFETATPGFTLVNASVAFQPFAGNEGTTLILSANNIFDVDARRHASFLKEFAPLAGRDIRLTARVSF